MLRIRLNRMGAKKHPYYRVVVSESTSTPRGRAVEIVGTYQPKSTQAEIRLDLARIDEWIRKGAVPSVTVERLIRIQKRGQVPAGV